MSLTGSFGFPELPNMDGHGAEGDIWYQGPDGVWRVIPKPANCEGQIFLLALVDCEYTWILTDPPPTVAGFGNLFGSQFGQD